MRAQGFHFLQRPPLPYKAVYPVDMTMTMDTESYVCLYVCMHVCMYVCIHMRACVCVYAREAKTEHTYIPTSIHACMHTCTHAHFRTSRVAEFETRLPLMEDRPRARQCCVLNTSSPKRKPMGWQLQPSALKPLSRASH